MTEFSEPEVAIVVLNWNNYSDTSNCLERLRDLSYSNYYVYVVDNGSTDGSREQLRDEFQYCQFIFNDDNLGFSAGNNVGIEEATFSGASHVLLLNNDTIPERGFLSPLVRSAEENERVAAVSGIIYDENGEIQFSGGSFSPIIYKLNSKTDIVKKKPYETKFITGAFMLLTEDFLGEGYRLDEEYFFGREDIDLSVTARKNGWRLLINPASEITHKRSSSAGNLNKFRFYHRVRNYMYFAKKQLGVGSRLLFYFAFMIIAPILIIYLALNQRLDLIKAIFVGLVDHLKQKEFNRMEDFDG